MPTIDEVSKTDWDSLTQTERDDIRTSVEQLDKDGWQNLDDGRKEDLIRQALGERDTLYTGRMARTPTLDGDREVFSLNLAAHKWTLAEGGEVESESGEGGNVSYTRGQVDDYLQLTRFGRTAYRHVDAGHSVSIVRSW